MKQDIILAGVGGQGIISIAYVIAGAGLEQGLEVKQAEVHGMSQRGGAVEAHLRLADGPIASDLIPRGAADLILSVEPIEALRHFEFLGPAGMIVASRTPFINIPDYPDVAGLVAKIGEAPRHIVVDSEALAREAGSIRSQNMVVLGAASRELIVREDGLRKYIQALFGPRGESVASANLKAFELGRRAAAADDRD